MTRHEIAARNRGNAAKSTGPKTAEGKAIVSGNARRHGSTSKPDAESVATWLAIVLDRPQLSPEELLPTDERGYYALALAEAEVRLVVAERALRKFEAETVDADKTVIEYLGNARRLADDFLQGDMTKREWHSTLRGLAQSVQARIEETRPGGKRHRLLKRYVAEARAQRRKALTAWLEVASDSEERSAAA